MRAFDTDGNISSYSREVSVIAQSRINAPYNSGWAITSGDLEGFKVFYNDVKDPGVMPTLGPSEDIPIFNLAGLAGVGVPVNFQPAGAVFNQPLRIEFPCPPYSDIKDFSLGLYDGSNWVLVWDGRGGQLTTAGEDWLDGEPEYNTNENPHTVTILVKHFTSVHAAVPAGSDARGGGGGGCFISTASGNEN